MVPDYGSVGSVDNLLKQTLTEPPFMIRGERNVFDVDSQNPDELNSLTVTVTSKGVPVEGKPVYFHYIEAPIYKPPGIYP